MRYIPGGANPPASIICSKFAVNFGDFSSAGTEFSVAFMDLPAKGAVHGVFLKHSVSFTGGLLSAYTLKVGANILDKYMAPFDVFQAPGDVVFGVGNILGAEDFSFSASLFVTANSTDDDLDGADAGSAEIWVWHSLLV